MYVSIGRAERRRCLSLLTEAEFNEIESVIAYDLEWATTGNPFRGGPINFGDCYTLLEEPKQRQVITLFNTILGRKGYSLTWYEGHGQEQGHFRIEVAHTPVTSR